MEPNNEHINELIAKYFAGEALPDEAILLDEWKHASAENLLYFNESRKALHVKETSVDTSKMFSAILSQINQAPVQQTKVIPLKPFFTPLRIAASLLVISVIGIIAAVYLKGNKTLPDELVASVDTVKETQLADGTKVALNKHTKLTLVGGFNAKERKLKLEGEAFFEVKHDEEKPFVIDAGGVLIKDIGTAFNVNARPESDSVFVFVTEGIVDMSVETNSLRLEQDESAVFVRSSRQLISLNRVDANINAYHTKQFSFKANTLKEVITAVNAVYGRIIELDNRKLSDCRITVDFNNESPETIVSIIAETLGLTYDKTSEGIFIIKGSSCIQ